MSFTPQKQGLTGIFFKLYFNITDNTTIMDLGGGDGKLVTSMELKKNIFVKNQKITIGLF